MLSHDASPANLLLIDDHPVVRMGYAALLGQRAVPYIFREAGTREEAIEMTKRHLPTIALLDLTFGGVLELSLISHLLFISPSTKILVVSMHDERLYAERVLKAGAKGYVMKHHAAQSIVHAVDAIDRGEIWLSDAMRQVLMQKAILPSRAKNSDAMNSLSDRELEVFRLLGLGCKKAEVASRLNLSVNTIETYRSHLKQKLGAATGAELYRLAFLHLQNEDGLTAAN